MPYTAVVVKKTNSNSGEHHHDLVQYGERASGFFACTQLHVVRIFSVTIALRVYSQHLRHAQQTGEIAGQVLDASGAQALSVSQLRLTSNMSAAAAKDDHG